MLFWSLLGVVALVAVVAKGIAMVRADGSHLARMWAALRRPRTWLVGVPLVAVVSAFGGAAIYTRVLLPDPPKALSFADIGMGPSATTTTSVAVLGESVDATTTSSTALGAAAAKTPATAAAPAGSAVDGHWSVGAGSTAGYQIKDTVLGMTTTVVGRTSDVSGGFTFVNGGVATARVVVNMQTVTCDCMHDDKYHDMLETATYPTSTFDLTRPIGLSQIPPDGQVATIPIVGNFTIHGVTREESFSVDAVRQGGRIAINVKFPIKLEDYNVTGGSNAAGSVHDPFIEFLIAFDRV